MKRNLIWISSGLILAALAVGIATQSIWKKPSGYNGPIDKITIGVVPAYSSLPILVAADRGYFTRNGLDVTVNFAGSGLMTLDLLARGEADYATASDSVFVINSLKPGTENLRIIASLTKNYSGELLARRDHGIQTVSDLRGKRIGIPWNSAVHFSLYQFLILQGITLEEVTLVDLSYPECLEAISKGEIDATLLFDYYLYLAQQELEDNAVGWSTRTTQPSYWLLIGTSEITKQQPDINRRLLMSLLEAQDFIQAHPNEAEASLIESAPSEPEFLKTMRETSHFEIALGQGLIAAMEEDADWRIERGLVEFTAAPNYLGLIYLDALDSVKPEAITISR